MKILSIGNSFSQDAQHWLHQLAQAEGETLECCNLYIGGCSLQTHWENYTRQAPSYAFEVNGCYEPPLGFVSIQEALQKEDWDVITLQQCSPLSGRYESYQPYLTELAKEIRKALPNARLYMHQTWAYDVDFSALAGYENSQHTMYACLKDAYAQAAASIDAALIPCGDVIQQLRTTETFHATNGLSLCRDGFHMSMTLGRYALAVTWFAALTGKLPENDFAPDGSAADDAPRRALIRSAVANIMMKRKDCIL